MRGELFFFLKKKEKKKGNMEARALTKLDFDTERRGGRRAQEEKSVPQVLLPRSRP